MPKKRPICFIHDEIEELIGDVMPMVKGKSIQKLRRMLKLTVQAREAGQNMENRLNDYRDAVEKLGFRRVRVKR